MRVGVGVISIWTFISCENGAATAAKASKRNEPSEMRSWRTRMSTGTSPTAPCPAQSCSASHFAPLVTEEEGTGWPPPSTPATRSARTDSWTLPLSTWSRRGLHTGRPRRGRRSNTCTWSRGSSRDHLSNEISGKKKTKHALMLD